MNRREAIKTVGAAIAAATLASPTEEADKPAAKRRTIGMLLYPQFTALDLVGPHHVFSALEG